eukprot:CAMPEP_0116021142 /NCGR_PEP_ID=MMETSP0321-20121206/10211_1 /TAXON_ID=163516 /ORGANISM="Leptocylindrus danicus var. danicus, Strain B650" /LENGTH=593 /DNA_ID=CAMNT_0003491957 /DNA_START=2196 /DNA_END=3977 /DNA_ORIENTATION=-
MDQSIQNLHETVSLLTLQYSNNAGSYEFRRMVRRLERSIESLVQSCRQQAESHFQAKLDTSNSELARAENENDANETLQIIDRDECNILLNVDDMAVADLINVLTMPLDAENIYTCCCHILTTYTALPLHTEHVDRLLDHMGMVLHDRRNSGDMMQEGILQHCVLRSIVSVLATSLTRAGASHEHDGHLLPLHSFEETITFVELLVEKAVIDISTARWKPSNCVGLLVDSSLHETDASEAVVTARKRKAEEIENDSEEEAKLLLFDICTFVNYLLHHASHMNDKPAECGSEESAELLRDLRDVAEKFSVDSIEYAVDAIESSEGIFQMENQHNYEQETLSGLFQDVMRQAAVTIDLLESLSDLHIRCDQEALATLCSTLTGFIVGIVSVNDSIDKEIISLADGILLRVIRLAIDANCDDITSRSLVFLRVLTSYGLTDENCFLLESLFHHEDSGAENKEESHSTSASSFAKGHGRLLDTLSLMNDDRDTTNVVQATLLASMLFPSSTNCLSGGSDRNSSLLDSANMLIDSVSKSRSHNDPWHCMVARRLAPCMNEEDSSSGFSSGSNNTDPHDREAIWNYLEDVHCSYQGRGV